MAALYKFVADSILTHWVYVYGFVFALCRIIASVSTSSAHEEAPTEPADEHKQPATRPDEPDTDAHTHIQQQDAMVGNLLVLRCSSYVCMGAYWTEW